MHNRRYKKLEKRENKEKRRENIGIRSKKNMKIEKLKFEKLLLLLKKISGIKLYPKIDFKYELRKRSSLLPLGGGKSKVIGWFAKVRKNEIVLEIKRLDINNTEINKKINKVLRKNNNYELYS